MLEQTSDNFLVVAAQLVEAACHARDGDGEAAKAHIAHAVALLDGRPSSSPAAAATISRVAARLKPGSFGAWQARRLVAHVNANLAGRIYIKDLAATLRVSVSHFCRAFKCTFGVRASEWITRRRIEIAQGLMLATSAPLSEIALSCGMCDQSHFSRSFRRVVGQTPHAWRQMRRSTLEEPLAEPTPNSADEPNRPSHHAVPAEHAASVLRNSVGSHTRRAWR
jgi:AraC-like DNA-binding protein